MLTLKILTSVVQLHRPGSVHFLLADQHRGQQPRPGASRGSHSEGRTTVASEARRRIQRRYGPNVRLESSRDGPEDASPRRARHCCLVLIRWYLTFIFDLIIQTHLALFS